MAKGKGRSSKKGKSLHQHLADSRERGPKGRFLPVPKSPATAGIPSAATTAVMENQVDFLRAIIQQREEMGLSTGTLDKIVLGIDSNLSVRKQLFDYFNANASKFDVKDPAGKAARTLFKETVQLADNALTATNAEAAVIYEKLKFIRDLARKTQGAQSEIAQELQKVIAPVEEQLKKQASFREFVKEKATDFKRKLPERLAAKIPVVGGLVSEFLQQRREAKESLDAYSGTLLQEKSSKGGSRSSSVGSLGGGTRASAVPGLLSGAVGGSDPTIGAIHSEVKKIRELLVDRFGPSTDELAARESELESIKSAAKATTTSSAPAAAAVTGGGGILSSIASMLGPGGLMNLIPTKAMGGLITRAGGAGRSVMGGLGKFGSRALGAFKTTSLYKDVSTIAKQTTNIGSRAVGAAKSMGSSALKAGAGMATKAGGWLSKAWGSVSGAVSGLNPVKALGPAVKSGSAKIVKGIVSIPGLGALISGAMGALDIASIKNDPELSADEKKERIGRILVGTVGEILGSVGGAALGSLALPGIGTLLGTLGGTWVGGKLAELLADAIGGRGIYDMVSSIPGVGSLLEIGGAEDQKESKAAEGAIGEMGAAVNTAAGTKGMGGEASATEVSGQIVTSATPNTTVGKMVGSYNAEMGALSEAQAAATAPVAAPVSNNSSVNTRINNTTNNFNDDLRIRNNEPTLKQAQMMAMTNW